MPIHPKFLFVTCQVHAENAVKREVPARWPGTVFAYSRPGFLTFKLPVNQTFSPDFELGVIFARAYGFSLGKATGDTPAERARSAWMLAGDLPVSELHVWQRDAAEPGYRGYEPGDTPLAAAAREVLLEHRPDLLKVVWERQRAAGDGGGTQGALVLDCVLVDEQEWWVGYHRVHSAPSSWPGGLMPANSPTSVVSRGYFKLGEALAWSGLPLQAGERVVEIGSAPGGATQALLERGLSVVGIDPAEMHPSIVGNPNFRQIRQRSKAVDKREFVNVDWLCVDINLPPNYTLDAVEGALAQPGARFRGMLLTLKLRDWSLAAEVPGYLKRIRNWGFRQVRARQLHHNRREICVALSNADA